MIKKTRQLNIIQQLLKLDSFITIDKIAEVIGVSNRTIRNDLDELSDVIVQNNLKLVKKTGSGIKIQGNQEDILHLLSATKHSLKSSVLLDKQGRISYIILRILSAPSIRIIELLDELYISRSTIQKDFKEVELLCDKYRINLIKDGINGLKIEGKERYIRNLMFDLLIQDPTVTKFNALLSNLDEPRSGDFVFLGLDLTDDEIVSFLNQTFLQRNNFSQGFSLNTLNHFVIRLLLSSIRINLNQPVILSQEFMDELSIDQDSFNYIVNLYNHWPLTKKVNLSYHELHYMQIYYLAYQQSKLLPTTPDKQLMDIVNRCIQYFNENSVYNFSNDQQLVSELVTHLKPVEIRLKYGIKVNNPLMFEIQSYYSNTFNLVKNAFIAIDHPLWNLISDDEIGYIALYLASSLERFKKPLDTLLITDLGRSLQTILSNKINKNVSEVMITNSTTVNGLHNLNLENYDLILSTCPLQLSNNINHLEINSILSDTDLFNLKKAVNQIYKKKNSPI